MDDIDYDELVHALRKFVDIYEDEIAPYAVSLCTKLATAYIRLVENKGEWDDEESEAGLTADMLITAIRRVLNSISGKFKELYPKLENELDTALKLCLSQTASAVADEALTCVAELIYNQDKVSDKMWTFFFHICELYI